MPRSSSLPHAIAAAALVLFAAACSDASATAPMGRPRSAVAPQVSLAQAATGPQECTPDSKLIGRIALDTRDVPGTWWYLTRTGLDAAGVTDYLAAISAEFGIPFADLNEAVTYLVDAVRSIDENGNGYVCAYSGRGTRAWSGDPNFWLTHFIVREDKHAAS